MDPDIVNSANPNIGGATAVKNALAAIPSISMVMDLPGFLNINGSSGIYSNPGNRGFAWERPCSLEMILPPTATTPNGIGEFQANCGVRIRGGFSRSTDNPKHAFHYYFRGEYGAGKLEYPLFGRHGAKEFDQFDLRTSQNYSWSFGGDGNNTFLREESSRLAQRDMGQPYSRVRYFHLYINGQYWGLFNTEERTEASFAESYFGGDKEDYDVVKCEQTAGYTVGATDGDLGAWQDLWNKGRTHAASPTNANYFRMMGLAADGVTPTADPVLLDPDNLIDYMLATFWTANADGATSSFLGNDRANNWFGLRRRNGTRGFSFFAHDFEHSFGLPSGGVSGDRTGPFISPNQSNFTYSNPMFLHQDLMGNAEYQMRFADRTARHMFNNGALSPAGWTARLNSLATIVDSAIIAESARWGDAKTGSPLTRSNWLTARDYLLNTYVSSRGPIVLSQLRADGLYPALNAPTMTPFGGYAPSGTEVVMSASGGGAIYYMPDGSDPRAIGGAIRPGAQIYTSSSTSEVLIPLGAVWFYLDNGTNQGTAWRLPGFDHSTWKSGPAELGYGDNDEATRVEDNPVPGYGTASDRYATTYFRKTFNVTNVAGITGLTLSVKYDDAVAIYINGQLVQRPGLPENPAYNYYTNSAIEDTTVEYAVDRAFLVEGLNTIAAEVHQASASSTDISFNLSLIASRSTTPTPFFITGNGVRPLRVRAYDSTTSSWSAVTDATFLLNTVAASSVNLAISEIMYHPANPTAAEVAAGFTDADEFEFLELLNFGSQTIDLQGLYFYGPIDFDFSTALTGRLLAPGQRILLVANKAAFEFRYGTGRPIAGEYSGSLNNSGERLTLFNASDASIRDVTYDDGSGWPTEADGSGYSLVLRYANGSPELDNDPFAWRTSIDAGGNAGGTDGLRYAAWKTANNVNNDADDLDGDGLSSTLEYVFGGALNGSDTLRLPRVQVLPFTVAGVNQDYVAIFVQRQLAADDAAITVETASDPAGPWQSNATTLVSIQRMPDGTETLLYRSVQPFGSGAPSFYRAKASIRP
jgi:hypothetical protein